VSDEGTKLLRGALLRCFAVPSEIGSLRTVLHAGIPGAVEALLAVDQTYIDEFYANDEMFLDRGAFEAALPRSEMLKVLTETKVASARMVTDAASVVFTHATVDGVAFDCCRAITVLDPKRCSMWVESRTFGLAEVMRTEADILLRRALDARLRDLERESLLDKVDFIYRNCRPTAGWSRLKGYSFDRDRLDRVDNIRHDVVHGVGVRAAKGLRDGDEEFLHKTGLHVVLLTMITFGVKIDANQFAEEARERALR